MFWPIILPFKIAFWTLTAVVVVVTAIAPTLRWRRGKTFLISSVVATAAFVPSCTGIMFVVDKIRFGHFEYATFADVNDFRAERYLPIGASKIKMHKYANGYRAQYTITETDFHAYLDHLWDEYGEHSAVERKEMSDEGLPASQDELERVFSGLGWKPLENAIEYYSPREADGGGATYYLDREAGVVFQRTGYW